MCPATTTRLPSSRRASLAIELLLLLPILLTLVAALVEFALIVTVNERLAAASAQGCRVAAQGGCDDEVEEAVRLSLGDGSLQKAAHTKVIVHHEDRHGKYHAEGETVEVLVTAQAGAVVPDLLAFIGLSIKDETLVGRTAQRKE